MPDTQTSSPDGPPASFWWRFLTPHIHSYRNAALWLIAALTLFRLVYINNIELVGDEAYYWLWSKHPDLSYFSKGPGVAWTIWLGTYFAGDTVLGIRLFSVLLSAGTGWCLFLLGSALFDARVGFWSTATAACLPLFGIGSVLMTIDPISVFFWTAAALVFWRAVTRKLTILWCATGFLVGMGMLAKYTNAVQLLCFFLFLLLVPLHRIQILRRGFWVMLVTAALCLLPVIIWNSRNDWITIEHLLYRSGASEAFHIRPGELLSFLLMQGLVISPLIFVGIILAAFWALTRRTTDPRFLYLLCLFLPLMLFYMVLSLNKAGEANWTVPAYITGIVMAVAAWQPWMDGSRLWRHMGQAALALGAAATIILHNTYLLPFEIRKDPLNRVRGSADLASQIQRLQQEHGAAFLIADNYGRASLLSFYLPGQPFVHLPRSEKVHNQFSFWPDYSDGYGGLTALYITGGSNDRAPRVVRDEFYSVDLLKDGIARHRGRDIHTFRVFLCRTYLGPGPRETPAPLPPTEPASLTEPSAESAAP